MDNFVLFVKSNKVVWGLFLWDRALFLSTAVSCWNGKVYVWLANSPVQLLFFDVKILNIKKFPFVNERRGYERNYFQLFVLDWFDYVCFTSF